MGTLWRDSLLVARKELTHIARDKRSQVLTLVLPIIAMGAFSLSFGGMNLGAGPDSQLYPMAVKDLDGSAESQEFVRILANTRLFEIHNLPASVNETGYMKEKGLFMTLIIRDGFGDAVRGGGKPEMVLVQDNTRPYVGPLTAARVKLVLEIIAASENRGVTFYSATLVSAGGALDLFTPGIVVLLIAFTSINDMATSLSRERGEGTLGRVFIAPISKAAFLLGKILAGSLLIILRALLILAVAMVALKVRFHGDLFTYLVLCLLVGLVTLGLGIVIAARARTDREVTVSALLVTIILLFMMGAITPVELMTPYAKAIAAIIPHTYATSSLREVMLLGRGLGDVALEVGILAASAAGLSTLGSVIFRRAID